MYTESKNGRFRSTFDGVYRIQRMSQNEVVSNIEYDHEDPTNAKITWSGYSPVPVKKMEKRVTYKPAHKAPYTFTNEVLNLLHHMALFNKFIALLMQQHQYLHFISSKLIMQDD